MSDPHPHGKRHHRRGVMHALRVRPSLLIGGIVLLAVAVAAWGLGMHPAPAFLLGFDAGALSFMALQLREFARATPAGMREKARRQDPGRWGILWSGVAISTVVLVALGTELEAGKTGGLLGIVVAAASIMLSWGFLNTLFALHYAHGYYGGYGEQHRGLDFPGGGEPDYWDFAYFAVVIGMTFQVSDVQVTSRELRRMVLVHGVIAFFFNVFILAVSVNIVAGQGS
ncbi:DUF1345 domain-containing protein [Frateuria sp. MAH-13]|uniref:DUF1345 domain-containing protein n=1 Tax=Frateuria flava TaxID=2821489 RepID=A0ABS4DI45_9GAMM|nr:DUF1345 domain-containing protein [Frateuria flava]MBP1472723.1 DUF1345 domain-containing protein [Frateuria flava]